MKRLGWILMLSAVPCLTGCTGGSSASKEKPESASTQTAKGEAITPASEVVAQFLDSFRRGDETTAGKLLTQAAIAEIKRCNLELAPPGSPESSFEIGKTAYEDDAKDTALVATLWTEPVEGSKEKRSYEAVFCVRLENSAWRIAGIVIQSDPSKDPEVIDFENLSQNLAQELAPANPGQQPTPGQPGLSAGQPAQQPVAQNPAGQPNGAFAAPTFGQQPTAQQPLPNQPALNQPAFNQPALQAGNAQPAAAPQFNYLPAGGQPQGFQPSNVPQVATPPGASQPIRK